MMAILLWRFTWSRSCPVFERSLVGAASGCVPTSNSPATGSVFSMPIDDWRGNLRLLMRNAQKQPKSRRILTQAIGGERMGRRDTWRRTLFNLQLGWLTTISNHVPILSYHLLTSYSVLVDVKQTGNEY
ncbi:hypothetical protein BD779DRAFT_602224 [Infundibulicybe gibba]|nr:hypothetical protein BD779DRAFT_602224 [Infundibulicybe gibba]